MNWDQQIGQILVMSKSAVSVLLFALVHSRDAKKMVKNCFRTKSGKKQKSYFPYRAVLRCKAKINALSLMIFGTILKTIKVFAFC